MHNTRAPRIVKLIELRYCFELTIFSVYNRIVAAADVVSNLDKISDSYFALLELMLQVQKLNPSNCKS